MSDETTLLPCPFCGGEAFVNDDPTGNGGRPHISGNVGLGRLWSVECDECGADGGFWQDRNVAISVWNTRAELGSGTCAFAKPTDLTDGCAALERIKELEELGSDEPPYDELLRCLESDWNISASWDGLRKFWCIELTEEGVKLRDATHGTLTAEQVREAIEANSWAETSTIREFSDSSWQAIADELNARAERTCQCATNSDAWCFVCSECGKSFPRSKLHLAHNHGEINYCPNCGCKVVSA